MREITVTDAALWARSVQGDGDAFGELFDQHRDRVFRHAYRLVGAPHDAEDVTATAFLELWRRRADVRLVNDSVLPWLLVTATNAARNVHRSTRRYRRLLHALPRAEDAPDAEAVYLSEHPLDEIDRRLVNALRSLSTADMRLLALTAVEEFTVAEAAEVLGLSPAGAKTRLHRARRRLRAALGEAEDLSSPSVEGG